MFTVHFKKASLAPQYSTVYLHTIIILCSFQYDVNLNQENDSEVSQFNFELTLSEGSYYCDY